MGVCFSPGLSPLFMMPTLLLLLLLTTAHSLPYNSSSSSVHHEKRNADPFFGLPNPFDVVNDVVKGAIGGSRGGGKSALIFLHGLGPSMSGFCKMFAGPALGLSSRRNVVRCPAAPARRVGIIPPTYIPGVSKFTGIKSWFNFWMMPVVSVVTPGALPGESKEQLEESLGTVEGIIQELIDDGIDSENIVVSGMSQGGALTLYTALHTRYKLGGFVPIVTWLPLLKAEHPTTLREPVNKYTPILHMNGLADLIVPLPAGSATRKAMEQVFPNYQLKNKIGTHLTTVNPLNIPTIIKWAKKNTNLQFSRFNPIAIVGGLGK